MPLRNFGTIAFCLCKETKPKPNIVIPKQLNRSTEW